jgi:hypothetical protein
MRIAAASRRFLVAACVTLAVPLTFGQAGAQLGGTSREAKRDELLAIASLVVQAVPALGRVWPGYWPPERKFILADSGYAALLYTTGAPPAGFEPVSDASAVPGPPGSTYLHAGKVPGLSASQGLFSLAFNVPGGEAIAVPLNGGLSSTLSFLFHEAFHAYQQREFSNPHVREIDADAREVMDSTNVALWEVERRILREALATDNEAEARLPGRSRPARGADQPRDRAVRGRAGAHRGKRRVGRQPGKPPRGGRRSPGARAVDAGRAHPVRGDAPLRERCPVDHPAAGVRHRGGARRAAGTAVAVLEDGSGIRSNLRLARCGRGRLGRLEQRPSGRGRSLAVRAP